MLLRIFVLFIVSLIVLSHASEGGSPLPPPPNGTNIDPPMGNGTEPSGPMNGTDIVQENGNKTGGVIDWIKSKLGK
ncbi:hypothetical protein CRE_11918 [Caenorhabditis remanei]|uniref:Uncharacterized protein n=1 Tax=Caenorhabditis remanei TaxID=31234 RepID=E3M4G9_CAERE|nr:hypothetical protein CRE_11918 [Caenorhabditis remanei]